MSEKRLSFPFFKILTGKSDTVALTAEQRQQIVQPLTAPIYNVAEASYFMIRGVGENNYEAVMQLIQSTIAANESVESSSGMIRPDVIANTMEQLGYEVVRGVKLAPIVKEGFKKAGDILEANDGSANLAIMPMGKRVDSSRLLTGGLVNGNELVPISQALAIVGDQQIEVEMYGGILIERLQQEKLSEPQVEPQVYTPAVETRIPDILNSPFMTAPVTWEQTPQVEQPKQEEPEEYKPAA